MCKRKFVFWFQHEHEWIFLQEHTDAANQIDNFKIEIAALDKTIKELEQKELDVMMQVDINFFRPIKSVWANPNFTV